MKIISRNTFRFSFMAVCIVGVGFMVGYWFYKYEVDDRDIGVVDYVSLEEAEDVEFPVVSMCFENPFLDERLNETDPQINSTTYLQYLKGDMYTEQFKLIDYDFIIMILYTYNCLI